MSYLLEDMEKWASRYDSDYFTRENLLNEAKKSAKVLKDRYKERDEYKTLYEKALKDTQEKSHDAWWEYKKEKSLKAAFKSTREEAKKEAWDKTFGNNKPIIAKPIIAEPIVAKPIIAKPIIDPNIKPAPAPVPGRNRYLKPLAIGAGTLATIGGGAYLYNRYKKKKRAQAEQEKTAARQFKDFEDFKNSMPKDKKKAANLKFSPDDFEWGEYDAGLGYNFEDARRWHYDTYKADPKEKESINNLYRSMHEDHQNFTKQQAAAKGDYEKALSRGKTMQRAGLGVSAGGAGLALLAGSGKLPKNLKVPIAATGAIAAIGGLGVRRKGRSLTKKEREKYNQLEIDYGKRHEEKINSPAFKNYWDGVHDHWGDWGQWMGPRSNKE